MVRTKIEWCDAVWNPVVGCTGACPYCYARKMAHRFHRDFTPHWEESNFQRAMPRKPSRIFVNSMSDVADWEAAWLATVLDRIKEYPQHIFLFLTKHPLAYDGFAFSDNCWLGVSIPNQAYMETFSDDLFETTWDEKYKMFLSVEPIEEPIVFYVKPDWIIVGAETGNRRERVVPELAWLQGIYDFGREHGIPLFFKDSLRSLWPGELPREFPEAPRG